MSSTPPENEDNRGDHVDNTSFDQSQTPQESVTDSEADDIQRETIAEIEDIFFEADEAFATEQVGEESETRTPVEIERDEYKDALIRMKADFDNYKKRVATEHSAMASRAAEKLVTQLLPVLEACDAAINQGAKDVEPLRKQLTEVLEREGLQRLEPTGNPFDPNAHEAVMHEPGDGTTTEPIVSETLRIGWLWNGRVIRPAMVKVSG